MSQWPTSRLAYDQHTVTNHGPLQRYEDVASVALPRLQTQGFLFFLLYTSGEAERRIPVTFRE